MVPHCSFHPNTTEFIFNSTNVNKFINRISNCKDIFYIISDTQHIKIYEGMQKQSYFSTCISLFYNLQCGKKAINGKANGIPQCLPREIIYNYRSAGFWNLP
jgi:hypothetical protein